MNCPECRGKTSVYSTRHTDTQKEGIKDIDEGLVERRRECADCKFRFKTEERIVTKFGREWI